MVKVKNWNGKSNDEITENVGMFYSAANLSACVTGYAFIATKRFPPANTGL